MKTPQEQFYDQYKSQPKVPSEESSSKMNDILVPGIPEQPNMN